MTNTDSQLSVFLWGFVSNLWFWLHACVPVCVCFPVRFDPCVPGGVFDCPDTPTSGWTTQLQRPWWSPPACSLQALSGAHCPQKIYQPIKHQVFPSWQPIPSSSAAASSPWLPAWKAPEATLLRTPQAMYVREPYIPYTLLSDNCAMLKRGVYILS